jgi:hypothetical protein
MGPRERPPLEMDELDEPLLKSDDGLPLLNSRDEKIDVSQDAYTGAGISRRLIALLISIGCSIVFDFIFTAACSTRGFSSTRWRAALGIDSSAGRYYFGAAGMDLLVLCILRCLFLGFCCAAQPRSLRRAPKSNFCWTERGKCCRSLDDNLLMRA